jgi:hypothetical protein
MVFCIACKLCFRLFSLLFTFVNSAKLYHYQSVRSLDNPPKNLHHEHVFETSKLIKELRTDPRGIGRIVAKAVACVVTRKEHKNLTKLSRGRPDLHGWDRYQAAGIQVIDTKTGKCLDWPACSEG